MSYTGLVPGTRDLSGDVRNSEHRPAEPHSGLPAGLLELPVWASPVCANLLWSHQDHHLGHRSLESRLHSGTSSLPAWTCSSSSRGNLRHPHREHRNLCSITAEESFWMCRIRHKPLAGVQDLLKWLHSLLLEQVLQAVLCKHDFVTVAPYKVLQVSSRLRVKVCFACISWLSEQKDWLSF